MKQKETPLTNETLASLFSDNFQMAVTAIRLAQSEVDAGHEVTLQKVLSQIIQRPHMYTFEDYPFESETHE